MRTLFFVSILVSFSFLPSLENSFIEEKCESCSFGHTGDGLVKEREHVLKTRGQIEAKMVKIEGRRFRMGTKNKIYDEEEAPREVQVGTFEIDETEVTNQQFAQFVVAENYITDAEIYGFSFV